MHLCLPTALGWKTKAVHPSKQCRAMSALMARAYQAGSALHMMAVLQMFQAKLFLAMDESSPDPAAFKEL